MFWADRITRVAGVVLLLLVAIVIADAVVETVVVADANLFDRADVEGMLRDINDDESLFFIGNGIGVVADSVMLLAAATVLYLMFRDRSQTLATFVLVGFIAASVFFLVSDAATITVAVLAADFVEEGGSGGIAAGDPATLQAARAAALFWGLSDLVGLTVLAAGFIALGTLLAWAPEAGVNPPRWLGGLAIFSGTALLLTWTFLATEEVGWAISGIGIVGALLSFIILGGWLLMRPEREPELGGARAATV